MTEFAFRAVPGYFQHDGEPEGPGFRATNRLGQGLLIQQYITDSTFDPHHVMTQWERFLHFLERENKRGRGHYMYKLVFVIRHGEGYHNVKEAEVGRQAWDSHWSHLDGDGKTAWSDARLTEKGKQQARELNAFWRYSLETGVPAPQKYYTSPLARCLETTRITYSGLNVPLTRPFKPIVKEGLRERFGVHTCDRRSTKSWIASNYPGFQIEPSFTENDELWEPDERETEREIEDRVKRLLGDIFLNDEQKTVISLTAHSGLIRALYSLINHREVWVRAGAMVPVLIRADVVR